MMSRLFLGALWHARDSRREKKSLRTNKKIAAFFEKISEKYL